ncbi:MAG: hypothetical protein GYB67_02925 [Chloroflexi bacterium]|nr:hypothetical protein [Chloroflexota bacterium]
MNRFHNQRFTRARALLAALTLAVIALAACQRNQPPSLLPTLARPEDLQTWLPLTEVPAPTPYHAEVTVFTQIDNMLLESPGWRYVVQLRFDGVFARTPRETSARAEAQVWFDQFSSARRVAVNTEGELLGATDTSYEAVRLGPDAFMVRDGGCITNVPDAETAAELRAGDLIGGVRRAIPVGARATINAADVYRYRFDAEDLNLPNIRLGDGGRLTMTSGELWIAPDHDAVVRFYVNLEVENTVIFDQPLPVTGAVNIRYDVYDLGTRENNINVPFGC